MQFTRARRARRGWRLRNDTEIEFGTAKSELQFETRATLWFGPITHKRGDVTPLTPLELHYQLGHKIGILRMLQNSCDSLICIATKEGNLINLLEYFNPEASSS